MEFLLLGPFEARDAGGPVGISRQKHRALLACLALRAGEVVSFDRLAEDLWGEHPPASARASLQNFASQLRRAGLDMLLTRPPGYVLDVEPDAVDLLRFELLVEEARGIGAHDRADRLRRALALWHGPPLADLMTEPFAPAEAERLEGLRAAAQEDLVDAELELGLHAELVTRIEALVAENPLRERLRGQLMLALYRCDRQAEALAVYADLRKTLVDELGIEPSAALRELELAILRQDESLRPEATAAEAPREVRRLATVLFAEIVLAPGDDPDTHERLAGRALREVRAASEYHGGSVGAVSTDELTAIFGGHEDDALRAARAAVQMRRALDTLPGLESRIAVASGPMLVTAAPESTAGGVTAKLARRLAETAADGEIVIDAASAAAAGVSIAVRETEPRTVRGSREAVPALLLVDAHSGPQARPASGAPLIGRDRELRRLRDAVDEAADQRTCRLAVVAGDAGIGKSRLAAELLEQLGDSATVLVGRCVSYGEGATYLPLREAIVQAAGDDPRPAIAGLLAGDEDGGLVTDRISELVGGAPGTGSTGEMFWAVRRLLEALAEERPLVLVFDDVHWAEPTFLDLVEYLEQWSQVAPLLLLCLTRPELLDRRPAWAAHAIRLGPLADEEARELVEVLAAGSAAEARARIVEVAEGNPLYAEQLAARAAEGPGALDAVPPTLEALISSRIDRLSRGERAVLERAAVVGREFWHGAVLHLSAPSDVPAAGRHLLELVRRGLIRPGRPVFPREDGFRFHHVLIRDVVYGTLPGDVRSELHERVADWLESEAPDEDELIGYHLEQAYLARAGKGETDRRLRRLAADAGDRLAGAGIRAAKRGDVPAAANLLGRATAALSPAESARRDLSSELALVLRQAGEVDRARAVLDEAIAASAGAGDRRAELRAGIELALLRLYTEPEGAADRLLTLAASVLSIFEELGDHRSLARTWIAMASVHGPLHCEYAACEQAILEAIDRLRRSGWPLSASLLTLAAAYFYGPTPVEDGIRGCRALLAEADLAGEANVLMLLAGLEAMRGNLDEAHRLSARTLVIYDRLGWTSPRATIHAHMAAVIELLADRPAAAEAVLAESCSILSERGDWGSLATQACLLGEALYRQGRYAEAGEWAGISALRAASDDASAQFSWRALQSKVLARSGDVEAAEALAVKAVALVGATDSLGQHGEVLLDLAEVQRLGDRPAAATLEEALRLFERKGSTVLAARATRLLAELAPARRA